MEWLNKNYFIQGILKIILNENFMKFNLKIVFCDLMIFNSDIL